MIARMTSVESTLSLGHQHEQAGRTREAESHYRRAVEQAPHCSDAHFKLGCLLIRVGRPADALEPLSETVRLVPQHAEAWIVLGNALLWLGRWHDAVEALGR